ncbi:MAG: hypothetical protein E7573_03765 [Ruminococcaceae bacterium]|nr:hypothetical protein [Oscillospiraceae bacterium]MBR3596922.1 hypothetical protein [Clostridia bacterium]
MLSTLIQTIANLGFDATAITNAFTKVIETIQMGDTSSLAGLTDIFAGIVSAFTGASVADITAILTSLVTSIIEILSDDTTSTVLSTITGA